MSGGGETPCTLTQRFWPAGFLDLIKGLVVKHETSTITSIDTPGGKRRAIETPAKTPRIPRMKPVTKQPHPQKPVGASSPAPMQWQRDPDRPPFKSNHAIQSMAHRRDYRKWTKEVEAWRNAPRESPRAKAQLALKMDMKDEKTRQRVGEARLYARERHSEMHRADKTDPDTKVVNGDIFLTPPPSRPVSAGEDGSQTADLAKRLDALTTRFRATTLLGSKAKPPAEHLAVHEHKQPPKSSGSVRSDKTSASTAQGDLIDDRVSLEALTKLHDTLRNKGPTHIVNSIGGFDLKRSSYDRILGGTGGTQSWLDDEAVNAWYRCLVDAMNGGWTKKSSKGAPFATFNTAWYNTVADKGVQGIKTWSRRQGIDGQKLLDCETLFLPINTGAHWTLLMIHGKSRTIEYLDSLGGSNDKAFSIARAFVALQLGDAYQEKEWSTLSRSRSQMQRNGSDCGVFACFNGLASAQGRPFRQVDPSKMPKARELLAIVLNNGGFVGDYAFL